MASSPTPAPAENKRPPFPFPWALVVALAAYYGLVTGYVWLQYWDSPEYAAALHLQQAGGLLGKEDGRTANQEQLLEAYSHLLEAVRLLPDEAWIHKELERVHARIEQRGWQLPQDLKHRADAVAIVTERREAARKPILAVGARDRGWDPESLLAGPGKTFAWSLVGAFGIVVLWAQVRFSSRRMREEDREVELRKMEEEVERLGEWRKGLKNDAPPAQRKRTAPKKPSVP